MDIWVRLGHLNHVLKIDRAVTLYLKLLLILFADLEISAHVNHTGEELVLF